MNKQTQNVEDIAIIDDTTLPDSPHEVAERVKAKLRSVFCDRLRGVVLYGSEARGDADTESDIDVLVLLEGPIDYNSDLRASIDAVYPLTLAWERPISPEPTDIHEFETAEWPLYERAKAEGIRI